MVGVSAIQLAVLLIITVIYAMFDVLNKRNIPDLVVYATIIIGIAVAVVYNYSTLWVDLGLAAIVGLVGFLVYRAGFLGGGDVLEFVFISLVLPIQSAPYYSSIYQLGAPFILSVIIAAGYTATIFIPLYYLLGKRLMRGKSLSRPSRRSLVLGGVLLVAYLALTLAFTYISSLGPVAIALILILAFTSFVSLIFETDIYIEMTNWIYPKALDEGDMIALNLMKSNDVKYFEKRYSGFGRLATSKMISKLKGVSKKLPVYRDSVPFSLFILFGVIISIAFGNLILLIIGI